MNAVLNEVETDRLIATGERTNFKVSRCNCRVIGCMLACLTFLSLCIILPISLNLQTSVSFFSQPDENEYYKYLNNIDSYEVCNIQTQVFVHPPEGRGGVVLLGIGSLDSFITTFQESTRIKILDGKCSVNTLRIRSCTREAWFLHASMVKMTSVNEMLEGYKGFYANKVIIIVQNPFDLLYEARELNWGLHMDVKFLDGFFMNWVDEQRKYDALPQNLVLKIYGNLTSLETMQKVRDFAPEGLLSNTMLSMCYKNVREIEKPAIDKNTLHLNDRVSYCLRILEFWRPEWGNCVVP